MHLEPAEEAGGGSRLEVAPCGVPVGKDAKMRSLGIYPAVLPNGKTTPLLKTLLTSACERNCYYCPFRAGRNYRRQTFKPAEMAETFQQLHQANLVEGLFLSSGIIKGGVATQDRLLETVEILRFKYRFDGYIHLKIMPGSEKSQVERAMQLANRLSINLEAPTSAHLSGLAPMKDLARELVRPLQWVEEIRQAARPDPSLPTWARVDRTSTATQFVVGAVGESDVDLLTTAGYLYQRLHLGRTYFSSFRPIEDTPLAHLPPSPPEREVRLYQASYLLRDYGFEMEELPFSQAGNLPLDRDPKLAWAELNLRDRPVELNQAHKQELLRVPGIGHKSADTILNARRQGTLREVNHLRQLGIKTKRMTPYILLDGQQPESELQQRRLFFL
ncbi:MAG: hypothetical protein KDE59_11785 [Anaerolineales bacterium]|nr:hypothetical protein [Anaerolineales bacterium]